MWRIILIRAASTLLLLLVVSFASFLLLELAPGTFIDPFRIDPSTSPDALERLAERYGLDQPWYRQYGNWLAGLLQGDLGTSLKYKRPVIELLGERVPRTLALALIAHLVSFILAFAMGLFAAERRNGPLDRWTRRAAVVILSIHPVVLALMAMVVAASTRLVPVGGGSSLTLSESEAAARLLDALGHLILPAAVLTLVMLPALVLQARAAFVDTLPSSCLRAARSRGVSDRVLLWRHAAPMAMVSVLSFWGGSFGRLLSGAFLVEVVTGWPGLGPLALDALQARDPFLLLGSLFVAASLLSLANLVTDLLLAEADPRLRLEEAEA